MKVSELYPNRYASAEDIDSARAKRKNGCLVLAVRAVTLETMRPGGGPPESKPVLYFLNAQAGVVLTKTLARQIAAIYGDDTAAWLDKPVELYTAHVQVAGQSRHLICARIPAGAVIESLQPPNLDTAS